MIIEFALFLLTLIVQQDKPKPKTSWEAWALSVNAHVKESDMKSLQEHQKLHNEIDVLRQTVRALEVRQQGGSQPPTVIIDPAAALASLPSVPAKTSEGKEIADSDAVKEVLDAVTKGKPVPWEVLGTIAGGFLITLANSWYNRWSVGKKVDKKMDEAIALPAREVAPATATELPLLT